MGGETVKVYLDAATIIYGIKSASPFRETVLARISTVRGPSGILLTSRLSRLECRVKPLRDGRADLLGVYDAFLSVGSIGLIEIGPPVLECATQGVRP